FRSPSAWRCPGSGHQPELITKEIGPCDRTELGYSSSNWRRATPRRARGWGPPWPARGGPAQQQRDGPPGGQPVGPGPDAGWATAQHRARASGRYGFSPSLAENEHRGSIRPAALAGEASG